MNNNTSLSIIDGKYTPEEANELIGKIYVSKIEFNKLKNLSSQVRYGIDDPKAIERIEVLKSNLEKFNSLISIAKENNQQLIISSEISFKLVN
jgi:hypothetical protein